MNIINAKIRKCEILTPLYFVLELETDIKENLGLPGQFYELQIPSDETKLRVPISIFKIDENIISFLIKIVGEKTQKLSKVKANDTLNIIGPLGNSFDISELKDKSLFFITGGVGYAPLYFLYRSISHPHDLQNLTIHPQITWIHGGRTEEEVSFVQRYTKNIILCTDDGSKGSKGYVTDEFKKIYNEQICLKTDSHFVLFSKRDNTKYVIACGPAGMLKTLNGLCTSYRQKLIVSLEEYMACGVGVCYGCAVKVRDETSSSSANLPSGETSKYVRVCKEGPIFDAKDIVWD